MNDFAGPRPVPSDVDLAQYFEELIQENGIDMIQVGVQLISTIEDTLEKNEPRPFAYGKLLNFLAAQSSPHVLYLCASALWELYGTDTNGT
jgi:hypothetical protein